jgi:hypothetical protein
MMRGDTGTKTNDIGNDHLDDWSDPLSELRRKFSERPIWADLSNRRCNSR